MRVFEKGQDLALDAFNFHSMEGGSEKWACKLMVCRGL